MRIRYSLVNALKLSLRETADQERRPLRTLVRFQRLRYVHGANTATLDAPPWPGTRLSQTAGNATPALPARSGGVRV